MARRRAPHGRWTSRGAFAGPGIFLLVTAHTKAHFPDPSDAPAGDPEPETAERFARDATNMLCAERRHLDKASHPLTRERRYGADSGRER